MEVAFTQTNCIAEGAGVAQVGGREKGFGVVQMAEGADQQPGFLLLLGQLGHLLADSCQRYTLGAGLKRQTITLQCRLQMACRYAGTQALDDLVEVFAGCAGSRLCHGVDQPGCCWCAQCREQATRKQVRIAPSCVLFLLPDRGRV